MMDEAVDRGDCCGFVGEQFGPFFERLVGCDEQGSSFVSCRYEFEDDACFVLVFWNVGEVVEDEQVASIKFFQRVFEDQVSPRALEPLHEVCCSHEAYAPPGFDDCGSDCAGEVAFSGSRRSEQEQVVSVFDPRAAVGEDADFGL